jgi:hypothetical protein
MRDVKMGHEKKLKQDFFSLREKGRACPAKAGG